MKKEILQFIGDFDKISSYIDGDIELNNANFNANSDVLSENTGEIYIDKGLVTTYSVKDSTNKDKTIYNVYTIPLTVFYDLIKEDLIKKTKVKK